MNAYDVLRRFILLKEPGVEQERMAYLLDHALEVGKIIIQAREAGAVDIAFNGGKPLSKAVQDLFMQYAYERAREHIEAA